MRLPASPQPLSDGVVALRPWREEDVPVIVAACSDVETARWIHALPQPYTVDDARQYVAAAEAAAAAGRAAAFAVAAEGSEPVGSVELRVADEANAVAEVGYWAAPAARGRGLTTRAVRLLAAWALSEFGAERVQIRADVDNLASRRVAENAGFMYEGVLRSSGYNRRLGRRIDYAMYSLLPAGEVR